jgi:hypothetical protein
MNLVVDSSASRAGICYQTLLGLGGWGKRRIFPNGTEKQSRVYSTWLEFYLSEVRPFVPGAGDFEPAPKFEGIPLEGLANSGQKTAKNGWRLLWPENIPEEGIYHVRLFPVKEEEAFVVSVIGGKLPPETEKIAESWETNRFSNLSEAVFGHLKWPSSEEWPERPAPPENSRTRRNLLAWFSKNRRRAKNFARRSGRHFSSLREMILAAMEALDQELLSSYLAQERYYQEVVMPRFVASRKEWEARGEIASAICADREKTLRSILESLHTSGVVIPEKISVPYWRYRMALSRIR